MDSSTIPKLSSSARLFRAQGSNEGPPRGLGLSLTPKSSARCNIRRQWTLCKQRPVAAAALPYPFLEINVSVVETLDLLRSSVEEEVVFQAAMQVPVHHALACRIEAYETVFASAPALHAEPQQLSDADQQFGACLASPPDMEEVHSFSVGAGGTSSVLGQRQAPALRDASGLLMVSFSLRHRKDSQQLDKDTNECDDNTGEGCSIPDASEPNNYTVPQELLSTQQQQQQQQRQASQLVLRRTSSINRRGQSFVQQLQPWPEGQPGFGSHSTAAPVAEVEQEHACSAQLLDQIDAKFDRGLSNAAVHGMVRLESYSAAGRKQAEAPLASSHSCHAVANLLGVGYMLMHAWQSRLPAKGLLQAQLAGTAGAIHPAANLAVYRAREGNPRAI